MSKDTTTSTQEHLPIAGIQDGVIIMNDASVRAVIKVEPINFELKSETEQNGIIYSYQAFLNSLEFPIQIVVHSKKLDLERYLLKLEESKKAMTNELLRIQTEDYVEFVRRLISVANIMAKRFYVVVSYSTATKASTMASFTGLFHKTATGPLLDQDQFTRFRAEVVNRANLVGNGLIRLGVKASVLETQGLIELFYAIYNPDIATEERLTNINDLSTGIVSSNDVPSDESPLYGQSGPAPAQSNVLSNPVKEVPIVPIDRLSTVAEQLIAPAPSVPQPKSDELADEESSPFADPTPPKQPLA
jgi:hypothetical protein